MQKRIISKYLTFKFSGRKSDTSGIIGNFVSRLLTLLFIMTFCGCGSYINLLVSQDYKGDKILVQRHADPCCGWTGLRFVYNEGGTKEHIIYYYWFDVPYVEKEVRTLNRKKVVRSERYQLVFDTTRYTEPNFVRGGPDPSGVSKDIDLNDQLLSTSKVRPTIPLNRIDSILLFHASRLLTGVDYNQRRMWLLDKAAGYIQGQRRFSYNSNGTKAIK